MKRVSNNYLYTLSQVGAASIGSRKTLLLSVFFFLTGISTGIFLELTMSGSEKNSLSGYLQQYLSMGHNTVDYPNPFFSSLSNNLLLLLIIFLAGLSALGFPIALGALTYKGMALGFCTGLIAETLKNQGIPVIITSLLPQNLILIPAFLLASASSVHYAVLSLKRSRQSLKKNPNTNSGSYLLSMVFFALLIGLACGIEAILYPIVLSP